HDAGIEAIFAFTRIRAMAPATLRLRLTAILPSCLMLSGLAAITVSTLADLIWNLPGTAFGAKRGDLVLAGVGLLLLGLVLEFRRKFARLTALPPTRRDDERPSVFMIAVWLGLATGLSEAGFHAFNKVWLNQPIYLGVDFLWMIPAADLLYFVAIGA